MSHDKSGDHLCPPCTAGEIKKGDIVLLKGRPCKIVNVTKSKTGKHGHAKCKMDGLCVISNQKICEVQPAHQNMQRAIVQDEEYLLLHADQTNRQLSLLDEECHTYEYDVRTEEHELFEQLIDEMMLIEGGSDCIMIILKRAPLQDGNDIIVHEGFSQFKRSAKIQ